MTIRAEGRFVVERPWLFSYPLQPGSQGCRLPLGGREGGLLGLALRLLEEGVVDGARHP